MCTHILIPSHHGLHISGRTLDFVAKLDWVIELVPRKQEFPKDKWFRWKGPNWKDWKNRFAYLGVTADLGAHHRPLPWCGDGLNEAGLSAASLWLPGSEYQEPTGANKEKEAVSMVDFVAWILGNFEYVDELIAALDDIIVVPLLKVLDSKPPFHYVVIDRKGDGLVLEFFNKNMQLHKIDNGVLANAPGYEWHHINLSNYENLSVKNGKEEWFGQEVNGSGLVGMPGDATPPSRFVRATKLVESIFHYKDEQEAVGLAIQILQNLAVPYGTIEKGKEGIIPPLDPNKRMADFTQWSVVRDHTNRALYFCSAFNHVLRSLRFDELDLVGPPKQIDIVQAHDWNVDVSAQMKPV